MLIDLTSPELSLTPTLGVYLLDRIYKHVLYGPEPLQVRSAALKALREARAAILTVVVRNQ